MNNIEELQRLIPDINLEPHTCAPMCMQKKKSTFTHKKQGKNQVEVCGSEGKGLNLSSSCFVSNPRPSVGYLAWEFPKWLWGETQNLVSLESVLMEVAQSCCPLEKSASHTQNLNTGVQERCVKGSRA